MTSLEKIDEILRLFLSNKKAGKLYLQISDISHPEINSLDIHPIINQLLKDGYLDTHTLKPPESMREFVSDTVSYYLSFMGEIFYEQGGYKNAEKRKTISANLQSLATWVIAIGTGLAGIYGLYEMIKSIFHK
ncbi:MAG: hypothetical protein WKF91_05280 [Segetibacter sp.]